MIFMHNSSRAMELSWARGQSGQLKGSNPGTESMIIWVKIGEFVLKNDDLWGENIGKNSKRLDGRAVRAARV